MRLDEVVAARPGKATFFVLVAVIVGTLLPAWFSDLAPWRTTTVFALVTAASWLSGRRRYKAWSQIYDALFVSGAASFDYLSRPPSPFIPLAIFVAIALAVMVPFTLWLVSKEQAGAEGGQRDGRVRS